MKINVNPVPKGRFYGPDKLDPALYTEEQVERKARRAGDEETKSLAPSYEEETVVRLLMITSGIADFAKALNLYRLTVKAARANPTLAAALLGEQHHA